MIGHSKLLLVIVVALFVALPASSQTSQWCSGDHFIEQRFPTTGGEETAWRLCWRWENGPGLIISHAFFRPHKDAAWIRVLWEARLAQLFVPYHSGSPRYYDVSLNFQPLAVSDAACPSSAGGKVFGAQRELCRQVKDRGNAWIAHDASWPPKMLSRRGEELVLWSVLKAGNYDYIIEWTFRDDAMIIGRVGATAYNLPSSPYETHAHDPLWRLDVDLGGACCDTVMKVEHAELGKKGIDTMQTIARERDLVWDAEAYTSLHLVDAHLNNGVRGDPTSGYHLMPLRYGTPRHYGPNEEFAQRDFWITRYRPDEVRGELVSSYVANGENVENADVVLWYAGSLHHMFRREDGRMLDDRTWDGTALLMWTEFQFKPMFLFPKTPLFP